MFRSILVFLILVISICSIHCRKPHVINFRWADLYPPSFTWDHNSEHFVVGSLRQKQLLSISDAGVSSILLSDHFLPSNSSFFGLAIDRLHHRLLAVVHCPATASVPSFSVLASYHLSTSDRLFLAPLPNSTVPKDVAVDFSGNAYVTDCAEGVVFRVNIDGEASILSKSQAYRNSGLCGVVYNSKGYLLVVQPNTGKLYKVNVDDGIARTVILNKELTAVEGIAVRSDGVVVAVSKYKLHFIKSHDSWSEGVVFDETALEENRQASAVAVGAEDRVYVLYGQVKEGIAGNSRREEFSIVEVESEKESKEENIWIFVLIGLGFAYFLFWRFQMKHLVQNMDKKTA